MIEDNIDKTPYFKLKNEEEIHQYEMLCAASRNRDIIKTKQLLKQFIIDHPNVGMLRAFLANTYWDEGDTDNAQNEFLKAIRLDQRNEKISVGYFHLLMELGLEDDAFNEIRRFVDCGGKMSRYHEILSSL